MQHDDPLELDGYGCGCLIMIFLGISAIGALWGCIYFIEWLFK